MKSLEDSVKMNEVNKWMRNKDEVTDDDIIKMVTNEETLEEELP